MRQANAAILTIALLLVSTLAAAVDSQESLPSADLTRQILALEPAAHSGDPDAQLRLSLLYSRSSGTPTNAALANDWLHRAAEGDNVCAMILLGYAYLEGDNVQKDAATAQMWLRRAAESGGRRAHGLLLRFYADGQLAPENDDELARWILVDAEEDNAGRRLPAVELYLGYRGFPKDPVEAYKWVRLAQRVVRKGSYYEAIVRSKLAAITADLTDEQRQEGERRLQHWKPSHRNECEDFDVLKQPERT